MLISLLASFIVPDTAGKVRAKEVMAFSDDGMPSTRIGRLTVPVAPCWFVAMTLIIERPPEDGACQILTFALAVAKNSPFVANHSKESRLRS